MAQFYYPKNQKVLDLLLTVPQGFLIEFDDETATLFLKFDMATLISIIKGCDLRIKVLNPNYDSSIPYILEILDNSNNPLWIGASTKLYDNSMFHDVDKLVSLKEIQISLLNETTSPIFSFSLGFDVDLDSWYNWQNKINISEEHLRNNEFEIYLQNEDHSSISKFTSILNIMDQSESFENINVDNFLNDGKHGYMLENSIRNILSVHFKINKELFISPEYENGNEFCDFIILFDEAYILIESKFILSTKSTKAAAQFKKGVEQLLRANCDIFDKTLLLKDKNLQNELLRRPYPLKLLVFNGAINITQERCKSWFSYSNKMHLPMFMSVNVLNQFINTVYLKNPQLFKANLERNLLQFFQRYYFSDECQEFLIFENFSFAR